MCGIAGILGIDDATAADTEVSLRRMLARLAHRGPDDEGVWVGPSVAMGMRRLSILDPTPAGHQPMWSEDGGLAIIHNGEIYNFLELAEELEAAGHRFRTRTDTEVILAAYAAWGPAAAARFNGIWAFAVWDAQRESLWLSRDRLGVKPLYITEAGGRVAFASEIKALLALPWVSAEVEPAAVAAFLRDGLVDHTPRTFFRGIRALEPATNLILAGNDRSVTRYWAVPALSDDASHHPDATDARRIEEIRALLVDSVALQLRSDVSLGSCLSGGIDSSSIVSIAAGLRDGRLHALSGAHPERERLPQLAFFARFGEPGIDEGAYAAKVATASGVTLRTTTPDSGDFLASLDDVVRAQDEPFGSASIVVQYHVMKLAAAEPVKVLLDGQGADELFAGYPPYRAAHIAGGLRSGDAATIREVIRSWRRASIPMLPTLGHVVLGGRTVPGWMRRRRMPEAWLGPSIRHVEPLEPPTNDPPGTVLSRILWRQIRSENLPALLRFEDRNSMAFGIEARVPFLDHRLVEAALLLPDRLRIGGDGLQKVALRKAVDGLVPRSVLERRDKIAFAAPQARWLRESASDLDGLGREPGVEANGYLKPGLVAEILGGRDKRDHQLAWRVLLLETWLRATSIR